MVVLRKSLADWQSQGQTYKPGLWMLCLLLTLSPYDACTCNPFISELILIYQESNYIYEQQLLILKPLNLKLWGGSN